jgi:agmatinase
MNLLDMLFQCLSPAGNGVYTVYAGRKTRETLQQKLYGGVGELAITQWKQLLTTILSDNQLYILGLPSDNGGGILRGANWGPLYLREYLYDFVLAQGINDLGDVRVIPQLLLDEYLSKSIIENTREWLYQEAASKLPVSPLSIAEYVLKNIYQVYPHTKIFGIGGDHSCSYPYVKTYLQHKASQNKRCGLIQFDAHTDIMKSRMGIPICFGSWVYHVLDYLPHHDCLVQIGIRSTAKTRDYWQREYGVRQYWSFDILENGAEFVAKELVDYLKRKKIDELYITFDIDALDASIASATGTPESDGLSLSDAKIIIHILSENFPITGADMMEVAPLVAHQTLKTEDPFVTTLHSASEISQGLMKAMLKI